MFSRSSMRALVATVAASVVALTGCASDGEPDPTTQPGGVLAGVTWTSGTTDKPVLEFDSPLAISATEVRVVNQGAGDAIGQGDIITINFVVVNAETGDEQFSSWDAGVPESLPLGSADLDPIIRDAMLGQQVGVQFLYASPGSVDPTTGMATSVLMAVIVIDVTSVLDRAQGEEVEPAEGLPTVQLDATGSPSIVIPDGEPPAELVSQILIQGEGPALTEGQSMTAHYTGWLWDGEPFDSSWARTMPLDITVAPGFVIQGWVDGLVGVPVGSQVLLIIPAELAYGDTGQGSIPPGATLVFVVDILAAV